MNNGHIGWIISWQIISDLLELSARDMCCLRMLWEGTGYSAASNLSFVKQSQTKPIWFMNRKGFHPVKKMQMRNQWLCWAAGWESELKWNWTICFHSVMGLKGKMKTNKVRTCTLIQQKVQNISHLSRARSLLSPPKIGDQWWKSPEHFGAVWAWPRGHGKAWGKA